jgi:hypothetical protein
VTRLHGITAGSSRKEPPTPARITKGGKRTEGEDMWKAFQDALRRLFGEPRRGLDEHSAAKARAKFWAEVREGQREAETESRP